MYFFIAFGASISGWKYCRPVISVDGTHLKTKYGGSLLIASVMDGNNHIFPIGYAIVDSENDLSWEWFFLKLKEAIGVRESMVVISDRHKSIAKAVSSVFPEAKIAACMQHLLSNLKVNFHHGAIEPFFIRCAKAYTVSEYEKYLSLLNKIDPRIKKYLEDADPKKWSRSLFPGRRYDLMTTNISESMNSRLKEARGWPVSELIIELRNILQKWFYERTDFGNSMTTSLTPRAFEILLTNEDNARCMSVSLLLAYLCSTFAFVRSVTNIYSKYYLLLRK